MNIINNILIYSSPLIIWGALALIDYITDTRVDTKTDEPCGYCGDSNDPNDICKACWNDMPGHSKSTHTKQCEEYWDRGLDCQCIPFAIAQDIRNGAHPEDVM